MKPLFVLIVVFILTSGVMKIMHGEYNLSFSGRLALSVMLIFTAIAHFKFDKGMAMMIPLFIPYKMTVVYLTGCLELAAAIGLLLPRLQEITGWFLIVFFIMILPANIYAAINQIDFQQATYSGKGLAYLWFRVPLQLLFIIWTYLSAIKPEILK